jgi:hypothetical protein
MLLCPTESARTAADTQELKSFYARYSDGHTSEPRVLDALLLQSVQSNSATRFYYQVDPDVAKGAKRSMVSAAAATFSPDGMFCHLRHILSPLARRVSFLADVLTQLERGYSFTLCTASVRPSYLNSMMELGA